MGGPGHISACWLVRQAFFVNGDETPATRLGFESLLPALVKDHNTARLPMMKAACP
jgi:hypothetical protein